MQAVRPRAAHQVKSRKIGPRRCTMQSTRHCRFGLICANVRKGWPSGPVMVESGMLSNSAQFCCRVSVVSASVDCSQPTSQLEFPGMHSGRMHSQALVCVAMRFVAEAPKPDLPGHEPFGQSQSFFVPCNNTGIADVWHFQHSILGKMSKVKKYYCINATSSRF